MGELFWPVVLLLISLSLLVLEAFIPSGGILGALSGLGIVGAIALAFASTAMLPATLFLALTSVVVPAAIVLLVRWWPHTPLGKSILIQPTPADQMLPDTSALRTLVGCYGTARTKMLPSGAVVIDAKTYDAISEGVPIDSGASVRVVAIRGRSLVVRAAERPQEEPERQIAVDDLGGPLDQDALPDPFADR